MRKVTKESGKFNASTHSPTPARAKFSGRRALGAAINIFNNNLITIERQRIFDSIVDFFNEENWLKRKIFQFYLDKNVLFTTN